jgi:hypothetical protein
VSPTVSHISQQEVPAPDLYVRLSSPEVRGYGIAILLMLLSADQVPSLKHTLTQTSSDLLKVLLEVIHDPPTPSRTHVDSIPVGAVVSIITGVS